MPQERKGGDRGIDGKGYFHGLDGELHYAVCQLKGGHLTPSLIRDFAFVIRTRESGIRFFHQSGDTNEGNVSRGRRVGALHGPSGRKIRRLQMLTIHELLHEGKEFDFPVGYSRKPLTRDHEQQKLSLEAV